MDLDALAKAAAARKQAPVDLDALARAAAAQKNPQADMSLKGRIKDNLVGVDDGVQSFGEKAAAFLNKGGESMTLGVVGDEAAAAADSLIGRGNYDERRDFYRKQEEDFKASNPGMALVAELAPALLPGAGLAGAVGKLTTRLPRAAGAGMTGAAAGGLYGFAEGEGSPEDRLTDAAFTAATGALLGVAAPKATDFAVSIPRRVRGMFRASSRRPTVENLRATKDAAYKAVETAGETFSGEVMDDLSERVKLSFADNNYVPETDTALNATLKLLGARAGKETSLPQLDKLRQNLWKRYANAKDQPQILDAIRAIDDVIEEKGSSSDLMKVARAANSRFAKSQLLEDAFQKARDQTASTGSGGNILNKYRQAVTSIINNEKKARFFSAEEIDLMRQFVRGTPSENAKRLIGKLSPSGNGLMMALHIVGGMASSGGTLPLMAVGAAAKRSADKAVERGADEIQNVLAGMPRQKAISSDGLALAIGAAPAAERTGNTARNMLSPRPQRFP